MHWSRQLCGELRVDFMSVGRLCYQDGHWYYRRRLVGLYQEIRLILLCLSLLLLLWGLLLLLLWALTCAILPLREVIMSHSWTIPMCRVFGYGTLKRWTELCFLFVHRSLSHGMSLEYKKWYMLWPTRWRGYLLSQQTCLAPSITSLWPFALLLWTGSATVACVWNQVSCCCCVCLIVCSTVAHILTNGQCFT